MASFFFKQECGSSTICCNVSLSCAGVLFSSGTQLLVGSGSGVQSYSSAKIVLVGVPPDATAVSVVSADILAFFRCLIRGGSARGDGLGRYLTTCLL